MTLLEPIKLCARPMMVDCRLVSPWWYAVSALTKPDSCATCAHCQHRLSLLCP